jgi:hypothetical protein
MAVDFTLTFTDAQAQRLAPVVTWLAHEIERHPLVQQFLADRGVASVDDLTVRQRATLVLKFYLQRKARMYERELSERAAGEAAEADVIANLPIEVD